MNNQSVMGLFSSGSSKGFVIDSGEGSTHIVPIYEGYVCKYSVEKSCISGEMITNQLKHLLNIKGVSLS